MMTDDEIIAVVQAHKEGKQIQNRFRDPPINQTERSWFDYPNIVCQWGDFYRFEWRVAPEPRKPREWHLPLGIPVTINPNETVSFACGNIGSPNIRVREVIE